MFLGQDKGKGLAYKQGIASTDHMVLLQGFDGCFGFATFRLYVYIDVSRYKLGVLANKQAFGYVYKYMQTLSMISYFDLSMVLNEYVDEIDLNDSYIVV